MKLPSYVPGHVKGIALQPSLSLILPVHNVEKTLCDNVHRVLDVLSELATRFEVLVVDDGSTDHTNEVAHELAREFPQVRVVRHAKRRGCEAVASTAAAKAQGDVLLLQPEGEPVNSAELRQVLQERTTPALDVAMPQHVPQPLSTLLLKQLSRWGEQLPQRGATKLQVVERQHRRAPNAVNSGKQNTNGGTGTRRPVSFLAHLRDVALGE